MPRRRVLMSGGSDRFFTFRIIPRLVLHLIGWVLLCRLLQDALPVFWVWGAFPFAAALGYLAYRTGLRPLFAIGGILLVPWILRLGAAAVSSLVFFDNGWFLTAPYLYFTALSLYLVKRRPNWGFIEIFLLTGFSILMPRGETFWSQGLSGPVIDSLNLFLTILIVLITMLSLASVRRDSEIRISGTSSKQMGFSFGRMVHALVFSGLILLLFLAGNRVRRDESIQSGGGLLASDMFRFDFNDVLSLEPEISLNAELTMLYREDGPSILRYLRRYTLSGWNEEKGFFRDGENESLLDVTPIPASLPGSPRSWPGGGFLSRTGIRQEYYLVALDPESFFALNEPVAVEPWTIWDDASFTRAYAVESMVSFAGPWELIDSGRQPLPRETREYYLKGGDNPYFVSLAEKITRDYNDPWGKALAIERWFHDNYYYSLNPGMAPDGNQLNWFLEESRKGYCSYFAFAMTRICRAAGIPSRVAVGFLTDPDTSTLGFVPVRSDQAHAWVEVWFDEYGWITFNPTSDVMAPGEEYPLQFISSDEWLPLIEEVLTRSGEVSVSMEDDEDTSEDGSWWKRAFTLVRRRPLLPWTIGGLFLFILYLPRRIIPGLFRMVFLLSSQPRRRVQGRWSLFAGCLSRGGYRPLKGETPLDWAIRVEAAGVSGFTSWTKLYLKAEYSPRFNLEDEEAGIEKYREVLKSWRKAGYAGHLRSFINPGWNGGFPW